MHLTNAGQRPPWGVLASRPWVAIGKWTVGMHKVSSTEVHSSKAETQLTYHIHESTHSNLDTMRKQGNMFQLKEQSKIPEDRVLSDMEMENPPEKKFRVMIIKMIKGFRKRMKVQSKK